MGNDVAISDAEWAVMSVLWKRGLGTAADVVDELADARNWSHRTIRTLLARLVEKGALTTAEDGHRYVYTPAVTRQRCVREEGRSFLEKVFGGDVNSLLMHFARESNLTAADIRKLKQMLEEKPE